MAQINPSRPLTPACYHIVGQKLAICFCMPEAAGHSLHDTSESIGTANAAYGNASKK